jgi:transmembrane sensor
MIEESERHSAARRDVQLQEAADWLAQLTSGSADPAAFARWRAANPAHVLAFARVAAAWEAAASIERIDEPEIGVAAPVSRRRLMRGGVAGAALLAGGSAFMASRAYAWDSASTQVGETRKLRLPDESIVALNTDSRLRWRFSRSGRELWLDRGEMAIELAPGAQASLGAAAGTARLDAGRFNARLGDSALALLVLRGQAIAQSGDGRALVAEPFHRLSLGESGATLDMVTRDRIDGAIAWQSGEIVFVDTPLAQAAAEYNRYLTRKIVIDDPSVGATPVGGRFLSSDPADFLRAVSAGLGLHVRTTDTGHHIDR